MTRTVAGYNYSRQEQQLPQQYGQVAVAPVTSIDQFRSKQAFKLNKVQRLCYTLAIAALSIAVLQFTRSCLQNMYKAEQLMGSSQVVHQQLEQIQDDNQLLKEQIALYHSQQGAEMIARERLNMVSDDEVLIYSDPANAQQQIASR